MTQTPELPALPAIKAPERLVEHHQVHARTQQRSDEVYVLPLAPCYQPASFTKASLEPGEKFVKDAIQVSTRHGTDGPTKNDSRVARSTAPRSLPGARCAGTRYEQRQRAWAQDLLSMQLSAEGHWPGIKEPSRCMHHQLGRGHLCDFNLPRIGATMSGPYPAGNRVPLRLDPRASAE